MSDSLPIGSHESRSAAAICEDRPTDGRSRQPAKGPSQSSRDSSAEYAEIKRQILIRDRLRAARIPARHSDLQYPRGEQWMRVRDRIAEMFGTGFLVAVIGDRGRGKTQMAVDLVRMYIEQDRGTALYVKAMAVFIALRETYRPDASSTERKVIADFARPALLVIDAIEVRGDTSWEDRVLNHIVDIRYDARKDTLLVGNVAKDEVVTVLGHSIISRANETGGVIHCDWGSYR